MGRHLKNRSTFENVLAAAEVGRQIYMLRTRAGLKQSDLAELVGTNPTAISRYENPDYTAHTLSVLRRVASALNRRVVVILAPVRRRATSRPSKRKKSRRIVSAPHARRKAKR